MKKQDYSAQDLRKRSSFFLNYIQACVNTGHLNEAVKAVVKRQLCENDLKVCTTVTSTAASLDERKNFIHSNKIQNKVPTSSRREENLTSLGLFLFCLHKYNAFVIL